MIRITGLRLHNVCQYADMEVRFSMGLNAVCGRNGSGKTSLLRGLAYALTGLVDGDFGTQTALQRDGAADPGWAEVEFASDAATYRLRRFTVPATRGFYDTLDMDGPDGTVRVAARRKPVSDALLGLFGITEQLLFRICWGRQSRLDTLLTSTPAEIGEFLTDLFDTRVCERIRDRLKACSGMVAQLSGAWRDELPKAEAELAGLESPEAIDAELAEAIGSRDEVVRQINALGDSLLGKQPPQAVAARREELRKALSDAEAAMAALPPAYPEPQVPAMDETAVRAALARAQSDRSAALAAVRPLERSLAALDARLVQRREDLRREEADYSAKLARLSTPDTRCRLCGGEVVDHERYESDRCELLTGHPCMDAFREAHADLVAQLRNGIDSQESQRQVAEASRQELSDRMESLDGDIASLTEAIGMFSSWHAWEANDSAHRNAGGMIAAAEAELARLEAADVMDAGDMARLASLRDRQAELTGRIDALQRRLSDHTARKRYLEDTVARYTRDREQFGINANAASVLESLRDLFSQRRVQARYLTAKVDLLNAALARYMRLTDMPFSLYLNRDTHMFEYMSPDGYTHPAAHLSGAQKNISAVVLQMAIYEVLQPSLNLFLVDEPSESLDVENKLMMASLFQRMNSMLPSIQGVMLIVTRDDVIVDSCESVVSVAAT